MVKIYTISSEYFLGIYTNYVTIEGERVMAKGDILSIFKRNTPQLAAGCAAAFHYTHCSETSCPKVTYY
jgi:hypothetical protein